MSVNVAVMQPYFFPYLGYFRLFQKTDIFVIYDCVQFPRRGFVHRNKFLNDSGVLDWLTLPLEREPRKVSISDLKFTQSAKSEFLRRTKKFPVFQILNDMEKLTFSKRLLVESMLNFERTLTEYLIDTLIQTAKILGCNPNIIRSSNLDLRCELRGEERILSIIKKLGGSVYINSPGGRSLYSEETFKSRGIRLEFLPDFTGSKQSVLQSILSQEN